MKLIWITCFALVTMTGAIALAETVGQVKINVTLSPAGSFVAESKALAVKGAVKRTGALVSAQKIVLDLNSLKTGITLRDRHMCEKYFEVGKFPAEAVLAQAAGKDGKFTGSLVLHGVTRDIAGTYEFSGGKFFGKFNTKLSDFKISEAKYMGVGVDDDVEVEVTLPEK